MLERDRQTQPRQTGPGEGQIHGRLVRSIDHATHGEQRDDHTERLADRSNQPLSDHGRDEASDQLSTRPHALDQSTTQD